MKIIISPSKTQKITKIMGFDFKSAIYKDKTDYLVNLMKKFKKEEIKKIMKTSDKLTNEIYNNISYYICYFRDNIMF